MTDKPADPFALFREALNQWEKTANDMGSKFLQSEQTVEMMHKGTAASMQIQNAMKDGMAKALSAANMPSKADIEGLSAQLGAIEQRLARIESSIGGGIQVAQPTKAKPSRTRKPPTAE